MSKKKECHFKRFPLEIYKHGAGVFFGDFDTLIKKLNKLGFKGDFKEEKELSERSSGITFALNTNDVMIWLPRKPKTFTEESCLTHEIYHAVSFLLRGVGIEHTPETEEAYAYAMEYLYSNIISWACS